MNTAMYRTCTNSILLVALLAINAAATASDSPAGTIFTDRFQAAATDTPPVKPVPSEDVSLEIASHWGGPVHGADIQGDYAYIANGRMFRVLDISDESAPTEVGSLKLGSGTGAANPGGVYDVKVRDGYAFVGSDGDRFFSVVDVSDLTSPHLVRVLPQVGGGASVGREVELSGDYAYVLDRQTVSGSIAIFDISDPVNAIHVGELEDGVFSRNAFTIAVNSGHLFVGGLGQSGGLLRVYSLNNPAQPTSVGSLDFPNWFFASMAIRDDHLYAVAGQAADEDGTPYVLATIDIGTPASPTQTDVQDGFNAFQTFGAEPRLATSDGRLYLVETGGNTPRGWAGYKGLYIFDIDQTAATPVLLGTYRSHGFYGAALAAVPGRVYLWDKAEGFTILDVTDPLLPEPVGKYHSPAELRRMVADGSHLYVSDAYGGFTVLDTSDAARPEVVANYLAKRHADTGINAFGIDKVGDIIYLAAGHSGLLTVDVADPTRPATLGAMRISTMQLLPSNPWCGAHFQNLRVQNQIAYLGYGAHFCTSGAMYLLTADVADPSAPAAIGITQAIGSLYDHHPIAVDGGDALTGDRAYIFGIGNPAQPDLLDGPLLSGGSRDRATDVAIHGSLRLMTATAGTISGDLPPGIVDGLNIHDISDPAKPVPLASFVTEFPTHALAVQPGSDLAYLRTEGSLLAIDLADPGNPVVRGWLPTFHSGGLGSFDSVGLLADELRLYVADPNLGLSVLDIDALEQSAIHLDTHK